MSRRAWRWLKAAGMLDLLYWAYVAAAVVIGILVLLWW